MIGVTLFGLFLTPVFYVTLMKLGGKRKPATAPASKGFGSAGATAGTVAAALLVIFEISAVLILRAHYTMDVFAGIVAAISVANLSERISPRLDRLISGGT